MGEKIKDNIGILLFCLVKNKIIFYFENKRRIRQILDPIFG